MKNANERELLLKDEVYQIVSCALEISNGLGHGLHEKNYENALVVEFSFRKRLPVALILNFKKARLEWERIALTKLATTPTLH